MPCLVRRRCKRLLAERDEARAQGYAEAALAVEQGIEIDRLREFFSIFLLWHLDGSEVGVLLWHLDGSEVGGWTQ
jgi:hypothetical protein